MALVFVCFVYVRACFFFFRIAIINAHAPNGKQKEDERGEYSSKRLLTIDHLF